MQVRSSSVCSRCCCCCYPGSLVVFGFGVCEDVRLQVGWLSKFFIAAIKGAHIWAVSSMNTHMCAQVKVQRKPLATPLKCALGIREIKLMLLHSSADLRNKLISFIDNRYLTIAALVYIWVFINKNKFSFPCKNYSAFSRIRKYMWCW